MPNPLPIKLPEFLHDADGEIRVVGHRISIFDVLHLYRDGYTAEMLAALYPTLSLAQIHYVIGFYHENQSPVDTYLDDYRAELDCLQKQATSSPQNSKLRQRLQA